MIVISSKMIQFRIPLPTCGNEVSTKEHHRIIFSLIIAVIMHSSLYSITATFDFFCNLAVEIEPSCHLMYLVRNPYITIAICLIYLLFYLGSHFQTCF